MTPRQQAAIAAMQGILASGVLPVHHHGSIVLSSIQLGDALLDELGSTQDEFIQAQDQVIERMEAELRTLRAVVRTHFGAAKEAK